MGQDVGANDDVGASIGLSPGEDATGSGPTGATAGSVSAAVNAMSPRERQALKKSCAEILANPAGAKAINVALCKLVVASN